MLSQYADDTTVFCRDRHSLKELLELADLFQNCSGLKINYSKSEALWLGKDANCTDTPYGLKWPKIRYLLQVPVFPTTEYAARRKISLTKLTRLKSF